MERIQIIPDTHDLEAAIRVGFSIGLPLAAVYIAGRLDLAVYAAFGALTSLYGHSEHAKKRIETQIVAALVIAMLIALGSIHAASGAAPWVLALLLAATVIGAGTIGGVMAWVPRGEIFFVLVLLVVASIPVGWAKVPLAIAVGAGSAAVSVILTALIRSGPPAPDSALSRLRRRAISGATELDTRQHAIIVSITTVGIMAAWLIASLLGIGHPFWTPVAVAAVMPALGSQRVIRRMMHLIAGTVGGAILAAILFSFAPGHLLLVSIIVLCQAAAELFVARQFGIAMLFLSPLAIGMSNISRGMPWPPLIAERLAETALGAVIAVLVILAGSRLLAKKTAS